MTNEMLANELDNVLVNDELQSFADVDRQIEALREAAKRLRKLGKQKEINKEPVDGNDALLAKLKVAKDALAQIASYSCICESDRIAEKAIAAIRGT